MVGARAENAQGGCGAAPESPLLLIACLNDQVGSQVTLARAVAYAAQPSLEPAGTQGGAALPGADVIACSLGPNNAAWAITVGDEGRAHLRGDAGPRRQGHPDLLGRRQRAEPGDERPGLLASDDDCGRSVDAQRQGERVGVRARTRLPRPRCRRLQHDFRRRLRHLDRHQLRRPLRRRRGGAGRSPPNPMPRPPTCARSSATPATRSAASPTRAGRHDKYGQGRINATKAVYIALDVQQDEAGAAPPAGRRAAVSGRAGRRRNTMDGALDRQRQARQRGRPARARGLDHRRPRRLRGRHRPDPRSRDARRRPQRRRPPLGRTRRWSTTSTRRCPTSRASPKPSPRGRRPGS